MRRARNVAVLAITLALQPLTSWAAEAPATCWPQSPRNVDPKTAPYTEPSTVSVVEQTGWATVRFHPREKDVSQTLYLCGQHFHRKPETPQGCGAGNLIELHHVYTARLAGQPCDFYHLDCCAGELNLVLAEQVRVVDPKEEVPTGPRWRRGDPTKGSRLAEWSGSTTGPDEPPNTQECKPPAEWSFLLGCDGASGTIDPLTLAAMYGQGDESRDLQSGDRVSRKLTLVTPP